jgi:predicted  nucleic acid-binding Zn-ribbon protein
MGKVKEEPKKVKKTEEKPKKVKEEVDIAKLREDLDTLGGWLADVDDDLNELSNMIDRIAKRMGM